MERDIDLNLAKPKTINFNSHAHVERDNYYRLKGEEMKNFNSHAHVERDALKFLPLVARLLFQLTRSRGA